MQRRPQQPFVEVEDRRRSRRKRRLLPLISALVVLTVIGGAIAYVNNYLGTLTRSELKSIAGEPLSAPTEDQNILVIGLDSRVDQNGDPFPAEMYEALHAGGADDGGYNSNVLMFVHIPREGQSTSISIPRDAFVDYVGVPDATEGKVKEAYGRTFAAHLSDSDGSEDAYQAARAAARQAQTDTVAHLLGDVRIDHFVEITMGAFFEVAAATAPLTVCLNADTEDEYSGAAFVAGEQQISAAEAMSFVRQRRDTGPSDLNLDDLDRTRRQQAFLISLAVKLKSVDTLTNVPRLNALLDAGSRFMAFDTQFDVVGLAPRFAAIARDGVAFTTLPHDSFAEVDGQDVILMNLAEVHALVQSVLSPPADTPVEPGDVAADPQPEVAPSEDGDASVPEDRVILRSGSVPCVD